MPNPPSPPRRGGGGAPPGITIHGHLPADEWALLLSESAFFLGLGDPIAGPSALEALGAGCVYLNPTYPTPQVVSGLPFSSQHPYLAEGVGEPYVCSYAINNAPELVACINKALQLQGIVSSAEAGRAGAGGGGGGVSPTGNQLPPFIPEGMKRSNYLERVTALFAPALSSQL